MKYRKTRGIVAVTSSLELSTAGAMPAPKGKPSRAFFVVGAIGCIINTMAAIWFAFNASAPVFAFGYYYSWIIGYALLVIGVTLASVGYFGIRHNYDSGVGTAGFAVGIVVGVLFLLWTIREITDYWFGIDPLRILSEITNIRYWQLSSYILSTIYEIFFIVIILWGVTHIITKSFTGKSGVSMAAGITLVLTAVFLEIWSTVLVVGITFWEYNIYYWLYDVLNTLQLVWALLFFISETLAATLFLMAKIPQLPTKQDT